MRTDLLYDAVVSYLPRSICHWSLHMRIKKCAMDLHTSGSGFQVNMLCIRHLCLFLHAHQHQLFQKVDA